MAKVILWDLMGTVVVDPFFTHVPAFFGLTLESLLAQKHACAWIEFERHEIDEQTLYRRFFRDGRAIDGAGLKALLERAYRFVPGMEGVLQDLAQSAVEMHALSNYPIWYELIERRLGLRRFMELSFISCRTGLRKPDRAAFRLPCRTLGRPPEHFIFVDDRRDNVEAARAEGMTGLLFEGDVAELRGQLAERLAA